MRYTEITLAYVQNPVPPETYWYIAQSLFFHRLEKKKNGVLLNNNFYNIRETTSLTRKKTIHL